MSPKDARDNVLIPALLGCAAIAYAVFKKGAEIKDITKSAVCGLVDSNFEQPMKQLHDVAPGPRPFFVRRRRKNNKQNRNRGYVND